MASLKQIEKRLDSRFPVLSELVEGAFTRAEAANGVLSALPGRQAVACVPAHHTAMGSGAK